VKYFTVRMASRSWRLSSLPEYRFLPPFVPVAVDRQKQAKMKKAGVPGPRVARWRISNAQQRLDQALGKLVFGELRLVGRVEGIFLDREAVFLGQGAQFLDLLAGL
jgi:hypothetical protein